MDKITDYQDLTRKQLVAAHNLGQDMLGNDSSRHVKKFKTDAQAIERIGDVARQLAEMHGHAELQRDGDNLRWVTDPPPRVKKTGGGAVRTGMTTLELDHDLVVLAKSNPKREGTDAHRTFQVYYDLPSPCTGRQYVEHMERVGLGRRLAMASLHWDIDRSFVALVPREAPAEPETISDEEREEIQAAIEAEGIDESAEA